MEHGHVSASSTTTRSLPERTSPNWGLIACAVAGCVAMFLLIGSPPAPSIAERITTLDDLCAQNPEVLRAFQCQRPEGVFLVVEYKIPKGELTSGPPAGVFSPQGVRMSYSDDIGDNPSFTRHWYVEPMRDVESPCTWVLRSR